MMQFGEYNFRTFTFGKGSHATRADGMCVMEAVAYVAGEAHSDHPACACPVISTFMRTWNDSIMDDTRRRELLSQFVFRLPGTKSDSETELKRSWMAFDWLVRECLPAFLNLTDTTVSHAQDLRSLPVIDQSNFDVAIPLIDAAGNAARAARAAGNAARAARAAGDAAAWDVAAWDAAWDAAAGDAAWAAAGVAARDAAAWDVAAWDAAAKVVGDAAAGVAARDAAAWVAARAARAAWDAAAWVAAARDAAWAAARDTLESTVLELQESTCALINRMIEITEQKEPVSIVKQKRVAV